MTITVFDPSIATSNTGDFIIADAVMSELEDIFTGHQIASIPTQDKLGRVSVALANRSKYRFVGGTNLLSSQMLRYRQWQIGLWQANALCKAILMGVGWWQYQRNPDMYTQVLLKRVLCGNHFHSVRDEYTKSKLESIGISNVINTGCPTMWGLSPEHCALIPAEKSVDVVFTLTDYNRKPAFDGALIKLLLDKYRRVYYWPQGADDPDYLESLGRGRVEVISPSLKSFDFLLQSEVSIDYVGTRLHGGVRALQRCRRALILAVDNRASEIHRDTNLPVIERSSIEEISAWIEGNQETLINMNFHGIQQWRQQFSGEAAAL